jgi:hypothetical protein
VFYIALFSRLVIFIRHARTMDAIVNLFSLDDETEPMMAESQDQQFRTDSLSSILPSLDQIWWSGQLNMAVAAEKLADGSIDCELSLCVCVGPYIKLIPLVRWQIPMGMSGLLDAFLIIVETEGIQNTLMMHVLRLIGNTCANTGNLCDSLILSGRLS